MKVSYNFEDVGIDGKLWTRLMWLRTESGGRLLKTLY
jgi:hypothetical protein